jgi:ABC-type transporter Mla subunit MlaD
MTTLARITGRLAAIEERTEEVLTRLAGLFDPGEKENFPALVVNLNRLVKENSTGFQNLLGSLEGLSSRTDSLITQLSGISEGMGAAITENQENLESAIVSLKEGSQVMSDVMGDLKSIAERVDRTTYLNQNDVSGSIEELNRAMRNIRQLSADLKANPWKLMRKSEPEKREGVE